MQENRSTQAKPSGASSAVVESRQEPRLPLAVPVKVSTDAKGIEWHSCCTYEVSLLGARIAALSGIREVGQMIWIQRHNRRSRYKVSWIGQPGTSFSGQVGVESLEPGNVIWENEIKARIMNAR